MAKESEDAHALPTFLMTAKWPRDWDLVEIKRAIVHETRDEYWEANGREIAIWLWELIARMTNPPSSWQSEDSDGQA